MNSKVVTWVESNPESSDSERETFVSSVQLFPSVDVKYFDSETPRLSQKDKSDWIDLRSSKRIEYKAGEHFLIPLGIAVQMPVKFEAWVAPRSSTFKNYGILQTNTPGIIDNSYCGDDDQWFMSVVALKDGVIEKHDRVCQFRLVEKMETLNFEEVSSLGNSSRGGYGSTGVK